MSRRTFAVRLLETLRLMSAPIARKAASSMHRCTRPLSSIAHWASVMQPSSVALLMRPGHTCTQSSSLETTWISTAPTASADSAGDAGGAEQARLRAMQLFPSAALRRKRDHGRAEALLLAYRWQRQVGV
jgi:hypothetical protein